jgi:hypothetical protein
MVQVLSKKVAVDTNRVYTKTESVQKKQCSTKDEEEDAKDVKKFQTDISAAISEIAKSGQTEAFNWGLETYY